MKTVPEKDQIFFLFEATRMNRGYADSSSVDNLIYIIIRDQLINKR